MVSIMTKSGRCIREFNINEKRNYPREKMAIIDIVYKYEKERDVDKFVNGLKKLAKNEFVEINIKFIKV